MPTPSTRNTWYRVLYIQVIIAVALGIAVGYFNPSVGKSLKPLGDGFIKLVKMMIAPIIFCTVVHGIASVGDLRKLGRIGIKSLVYFEVVSTLALVIGLVVVNFLQPGVGITPPGEVYHATDETAAAGSSYVEKAKSLNEVEFILNIIPSSFLGAFVSGELLQVLLVAILVAVAIASMGEPGRPILGAIEQIGGLFFAVMNIVVKAAPHRCIWGDGLYSRQAVPGIPIEALGMLLGIDRFMSECRALTNFIGNGVATIAISRWENEVTPEQLRRNFEMPISETSLLP